MPRRGLEPDSGPDDEPMIVERRGSPADTDSLVFEEDMGEYPDDFPDNSDEPFVSMYEMASKQRQEKRKKKRKKKHKKKSKKKASASSKGVNLLKLAAFAKGDDEDAQLTDDEQKPPTKGRFRQPSVCQMEEELLEKTDFIYLIGRFQLILRFDIRTDKFFGIVIKIAHLYGFQGSWNVIPRMLAKIIDGIPI